MGIFKKIKKRLKKVAKPALGIGAALLAAKALKGRKGNVANTANMENISGINIRPTDLSAEHNYIPRIPDHPSNIQSITGGGSAPMTWRRHLNKALGTNFKKGGRVTGIAKRGFGRALMKGKK